MNIHSPAEVIETMCLLTHDANDVSIEVEYETIIIKAAGGQNNYFSMRWSYPCYGNERVRQIAKEYYLVLMKAQREENKSDEADGKAALEALKEGGAKDWELVKKELDIKA